MVKEFTDFPDVGAMQQGDLPVGTRSGINVQYDFPGNGVQDSHGNWMFCWTTNGASAVNFINVINANSGSSPGFYPNGIDANIGMNFSPKGSGSISFFTSGAGNFNYTNTGLGGVNFNFGGLFSLNGSNGIKTVSNDPTLANNSQTAAITEYAVKSYIDAHIVGLPFFNVTGPTQQMASGTIYYCTYAGNSVLTLPTTASAGSIIQIIAGPPNNTFNIAQNSGQNIYFGSQNGIALVTTTGITGSLQSSDPITIVNLMCVVANTTWVVSFCQQNLIGA